MSTSFFSETTDAVEGSVNPYQTTSRMAMMSLIFGLLSSLALLAPVLVLFSVLGIAACIAGLSTIRLHPDEYTGRSAALAGGLLSLLLGIGSIAFHTYVYYTEVPDGYERITFKVLQPEQGSPYPIPVDAMDLDGKQVFVGGYMHPDAGLAPVQSFVLVPDMGTCCFGGQPNLTDMIEVTLKGNDQVSYSTRKRKFAGTLRVHPMLKPREKLQGTYYQLDVDRVVR